jgi:hypothetical protein
MAKNLVLENDAVNAQANALAALCNNGYIRIKSSGNVLLAELRFGATAFGAAAAGVLTANAITAEDAALDTATASKYEVYKSDGTTLLWTGTVGTADADLVLNSVGISAGAQVTITGLVHTVPKS